MSQGVAVKRTVTGIQLHHHVQLDDAVRGLANGLTGLRGAHRLTDNPRLIALHDQLQAGMRDVAEERDAAAERFRRFYVEDPDRFKRCRDGHEPWPDEVAAGFTARCTCHDACLHSHGLEPGPNGICNCDGVKPPCPQHEQA